MIGLGLLLFASATFRLSSSAAVAPVSSPTGTQGKPYGANPTFFLSGTQTVKSPLLRCSEKTSYMRFTYSMNLENSQFDVTLNTLAYSDVDGTDHITSKKKFKDKKDKEKDGKDCFQVLDKDLMKECKTFIVVAIFHVATGDVLRLTDFEFGDDSICSTNTEPRTQFDCSFEDGDCGIRNDACGLVAWEIRSSDSASDSTYRRSADCTKHKHIPLLKKTISSTCSYDHLQIVNLQQSGFTVFQSSDADANHNSRRKRSLGAYQLYLEAPENSNIGIGILDLPEVQYHSANAILKFYHDMASGGIHSLMVTAICTPDPANSLVPLDGSFHYFKQNLDGTGSNGYICLDIHSHVDETVCPQFAIQLRATIVDSDMMVDLFSFFDSITASGCTAVDNSQ